MEITLPELTGSEKQISWANDLRETASGQLADVVNCLMQSANDPKFGYSRRKYDYTFSGLLDGVRSQGAMEFRQADQQTQIRAFLDAASQDGAERSQILRWLETIPVEILQDHSEARYWINLRGQLETEIHAYVAYHIVGINNQTGKSY